MLYNSELRAGCPNLQHATLSIKEKNNINNIFILTPSFYASYGKSPKKFLYNGSDIKEGRRGAGIKAMSLREKKPCALVAKSSLNPGKTGRNPFIKKVLEFLR